MTTTFKNFRSGHHSKTKNLQKKELIYTKGIGNKRRVDFLNSWENMNSNIQGASRTPSDMSKEEIPSRHIIVKMLRLQNK